MPTPGGALVPGIDTLFSGQLGYQTTAPIPSVTQATSRTTGVLLHSLAGRITMFAAAGSATAASFTVTNNQVQQNDIILVSVKSATNLYELFVTAVADGSFQITFFTTGGTSSDSPVITFAVFKVLPVGP